MKRYSNIAIKYRLFLNSSIWPVDGTLTNNTSRSYNETRSNGNEVLLNIAIKYKWFLNKSIWLIDGTPTGMKRYSTLRRALELEPHHQIQFSVISETLLF